MGTDSSITGVGYGWRAFALDDGRLLPPFQRRFFSDRLDATLDAWRPGVNVARCLVAEHLAPDPDCGCGLYVVNSLPALLRDLTTRTWPGDDRPVADLVDAVGRIKYGIRHPDVYPVDPRQGDPDTTVRVARGWLVELWLSPAHEDLVELLHNRLGVPVRVARSWPHDVDPAPKLRAALAALNLRGWVDQPEIWLGIAERAADGFRSRSGLTPADVRSALFWSGGGMTFAQCKGVVTAAVEFLAPETAHEPDQLMFGRPITTADVLARSVRMTV